MAENGAAQRQVMAALLTIRAEKGDRFEASAKDIHARLPKDSQIGASTVTYHLDKLAEAGQVHIDSQGQRRPRIYDFSKVSGSNGTANVGSSNGSAKGATVQTSLTDADTSGAADSELAGRLDGFKASLEAVRQSQREKREQIERLTAEWAQTEADLAEILNGALKAQTPAQEPTDPAKAVAG